MNRHIVDIRTDKDLGLESFVSTLLTEWYNLNEGRLRPEFFGVGEPVRRSFAKEGIAAATKTWVSKGMSLYLRRRSNPKFLAAIEWFRREKGLDRRIFPWSCTVWLEPVDDGELALQLLRFLIRHFEPGFGHVSTEEDERAKHFVRFEDVDGTTEMYLGQDITEPAQVLPGIYWLTYFGEWAVKKIERDRFRDLQAQKVERIGNGYLITAYPSISDAGSALATDSEQHVRLQLGTAHFFDKTLVEIAALKIHPETAALAEEKINEMKEEKATVRLKGSH
jgi:hypothetical protein